jgi:photosystem II stability/assembly factor-like uncharacterized protein
MPCRLSVDFSDQFSATFNLERASEPGFFGKFLVTKDVLPGVPGFSLTQASPLSPIGIMPFSIFNGVEVTQPLNLAFKTADFTSVTNLLLQSNDFSNTSAWTNSFPALGLSQGAVDPYGTSLGWTITDNDILGVEKITQQGALPVPNFPYTFSLFVKEGSPPVQSNFEFTPTGGIAGTFPVTFALTWSAGAPIVGAFPSSVQSAHVSADLGNGWFRIAVTYTHGYIADNTSFSISIAPAGPGPGITGDLLIYGAQFEQGLRPNGWPTFDTHLLASAPGYTETTTTIATVNPPIGIGGIAWQIQPGDGGSRGGVEWMKVRIPFEPEAPVDSTLLAPYDTREVDFYPINLTSAPGVYYRTLVASGTQAPGYPDYAFQFDNLPIGKYNLLCEAKQTFNPNPLFITREFEIGNDPHIVIASGVPTSGVNPLEVDLFSSVFVSHSGTNIIPNSNEFTAATWTNPFTTFKTAADPFDASNNASLVIGLSPGAVAFFRDTITLPASNIPYTFSFFARITASATTTDSLCFLFFLSGAVAFVNIDWSTTPPIISNLPALSTYSPTFHAVRDMGLPTGSPGTNWYRFGVTTNAVDVGTSTIAQFGLSPGSGTLDTAIFYGTQVEEGSNISTNSTLDDFLTQSSPGYIGDTGASALTLNFNVPVISDFEFVHWDLGTERLFGVNTDFYRNPTHVFDRQGFYNPIVTYVGFESSPRLVSSEVLIPRTFAFPPLDFKDALLLLENFTLVRSSSLDPPPEDGLLLFEDFNIFCPKINNFLMSNEFNNVPQWTAAPGFLAGAGQSSFVDPFGTLLAWQINDNLITPTTPQEIHQTAYIPQTAITGYDSLASGQDHGLALKSDGSIVSWGNDNFLQVTDTPSLAVYQALAGGDLHSLALRTNGAIDSWGRDSENQVGGTPAGTAHVAIDGGSLHSLALTSVRAIVGWGADGSNQVSGKPSGDGFEAISAGRLHSLAIDDVGAIVGWGLDVDGQVSGHPTVGIWTNISAGGNHSLAIDENSAIESWGSNSGGQVSGTPGGSNFVAISAGFAHSLALTSVGQIICWGDDTFGQVTNVPLDIGFQAIAAGRIHNYALAADGSVVSWGYANTPFPRAIPFVQRPCTISLYVKQGTSIESEFNAEFFRLDNGVIPVNTKFTLTYPAPFTPQLTHASGPLATLHDIVAFPDGWHRIAFSWDIADIGPHDVVTFSIRPAAVTAATGSLNVYGAELTQGLLQSFHGLSGHPTNIALSQIQAPGYVGHTEFLPVEQFIPCQNEPIVPASPGEKLLLSDKCTVILSRGLRREASDELLLEENFARTGTRSVTNLALASNEFTLVSGFVPWSVANNGLPLFGASPFQHQRVTALMVDPTNSSVVYAGIEFGQVYKTTDGGANWSDFSTGLPGPPGSSPGQLLNIAINPTNTSILYVACQNDGVFKTTNGGTSWSAVNTGLTSTAVRDVIIDPQTPTTLYAAVFGGVNKSTNSGSTWSDISTGITTSQIKSIVIDPQTTSILYASDSSGGGVYKTTNSGGSWSVVNTGITGVGLNVRDLAIDAITPTTVYACGGAVLKSTNSGANWTDITPTHNMTTASFLCVSIDPVDPDRLLLGTFGDGVYGSDNGGTSFSDENSGLPAFNTTTTFLGTQSLAIDARTGSYYVGADPSPPVAGAGVFKSPARILHINWRMSNPGTFTGSDFYGGLLLAPQFALSIPDPFGGNTAITLTDDSTTVAQCICQQIFNLPGQGLLTPRTFSMFVKQGTATESSHIQLTFSPPGQHRINFELSWSGGIPTLAHSFFASSSTIHPNVSMGSGWFRIAATVVGTTFNSAQHCHVVIAPSSTPPVNPVTFDQGSVTGTGSLSIYGVQFEDHLGHGPLAGHPNGSVIGDNFVLSTAPGYVGHTGLVPLTLIVPF